MYGFKVYRSQFDSRTADWLVESPTGKRLKIQVKSADIDRRGLPIINFRCSDSRTEFRCDRELYSWLLPVLRYSLRPVI
ncbi:hypothetical protein [[Phormidium ambiguum] IAM M-71]|uniref:hypothetical protein n=1 Tax=[Phormidium ambiguum] IAM M-71 TaxID=454136 RepID=UPI001160EA26|nr:hypothetical protein [Phormidium ambiguum]